VSAVPPQPTLTDGVVVLRPWRDEDIEPTRLAHDEETARWFGFPAVIPSRERHTEAVEGWRRSYADDRRTVNFLVEHEGLPAGIVEVRRRDDGVAELSWALFAAKRGQGLAMRSVRLLVRYAFDELGAARVEAYVDPANLRSLRVAARAGLRREGVLRMRGVTGEVRNDSVLLARVAEDPEPGTGLGFRGVLNAGLPRKRAIAQLLMRDAQDRVLLCRLTYKDDWDLPGGVSEVGESPAETAAREVQEELGLTVPARGLLVVDWLPPWSGWDDALCLVFDGGRHEEDLPEQARLEPREILEVAYCDLDEVRARCRDFTARRIEVALSALERGTTYVESGMPCVESGTADRVD
jgi:RimJ/RimL family protein N-acetyltransferase/8-oxo-dGTP pyrophosphatase MutT (NUDIX family)